VKTGITIVSLLLLSNLCCKHIATPQRQTVEKGATILLVETTVAEVNGLRVGCGSVFKGPDEKIIRATIVVMSGADESSKRVAVGDRIKVGDAFFVVESIDEGKGRALGSVRMKKLNEQKR
jgi:hypothetical protein